MVNIFEKEIHDIKSLIGLTVLEIELDDSHGELSLKLKDSHNNIVHVFFEARAGCCSQSWIETLDGKEDIIGCEISDIIEHDSIGFDWDETYKPPHGGINQQRSNVIYNYEIITPKGSCVIDFRNTSNGYYGGYLSLVNCVKEKAD